MIYVGWFFHQKMFVTLTLSSVHLFVLRRQHLPSDAQRGYINNDSTW